jgi:predicted exporter
MNLDKIKEFFNNLSTHDLLTGGAVLVGIVLLLLLVFKSGKFFIRFLLFLIAIGLIAGAWWWHQHR